MRAVANGGLSACVQVMNDVDRRLVSAPELTSSLLACVSALAAGAPSSMTVTLLVRMWSRYASFSRGPVGLSDFRVV